MNFEDLTPEQQAKVKACKSAEELLELAKAEGVDIPDEQLEQIAGGSWSKKGPTCSKCGSSEITINPRDRLFICRGCGHKWMK